jgi:hypothetical protein
MLLDAPSLTAKKSLSPAGCSFGGALDLVSAMGDGWAKALGALEHNTMVRITEESKPICI